MRATRRGCAGLAAAALALLAACGDGSLDQAVRESAGATVVETTTTVVPTSASTAAAGRTTTSAAGRTTTTRRADPTNTVPAGAAALTPAVPGTYRYDTVGALTIAGTARAFPAVTSLVVDAPAGTVQRATRDLRDPTGSGLSSAFTLDYRAEGVFLVSLRLTTAFNGIVDARDLRPATPVLLLATGARPGAHLEADLAGTSSARLVVDVLREERLTIAGKALDTLVMRATVTLGPGDLTGRQELTVHVDRGSRLWVKEVSVTDASALAGLVTAHGEYTATIQRLTP